MAKHELQKVWDYHSKLAEDLANSIIKHNIFIGNQEVDDAR